MNKISKTAFKKLEEIEKIEEEEEDLLHWIRYEDICPICGSLNIRKENISSKGFFLFGKTYTRRFNCFGCGFNKTYEYGDTAD